MFLQGKKKKNSKFYNKARRISVRLKTKNLSRGMILSNVSLYLVVVAPSLVQ